MNPNKNRSISVRIASLLTVIIFCSVFFFPR